MKHYKRNQKPDTSVNVIQLSLIDCKNPLVGSKCHLLGIFNLVNHPMYLSLWVASNITFSSIYQCYWEDKYVSPTRSSTEFIINKRILISFNLLTSLIPTESQTKPNTLAVNFSSSSLSVCSLHDSIKIQLILTRRILYHLSWFWFINIS